MLHSTQKPSYIEFTLAGLLLEIRDKKGMSQAGMAGMLLIPLNDYIFIEEAKGGVDLPMLFYIWDRLGIPMGKQQRDYAKPCVEWLAVRWAQWNE